MRLRAGIPQDAPALGAILTAWVAETHWMPKLHNPSEDVAFVGRTIASDTVRVALGDDGRPLGFLARSAGYISCLYVASEARGQGTGTCLLAEAKQAADRLCLWTFAQNTGARRFYARNGFAQTGETAGDNAEGLPDVELTWVKGAV
ncbi:MAG: GNAT family N-acetyltransferase [Pseudomonadota bacterium]